jgi:hypothetical protein
VLTVLWLVIAGLGVLLLTIRSVKWAVNRRRRPAKVVPLPCRPSSHGGQHDDA